MSRIVITGSQGQLGRALQTALAGAPHTCIALDRQSCDIASRSHVVETLHALQPEYVINTAAMTQVDLAETEPDAAFTINRDGPAHLAEACAQIGASLVHVSTDYVFGHPIGRPFVETDPIEPLNVYGASKAAGEIAVADRLENHLILRTSWVYSHISQNFFMMMMRLADTRETIRVVRDEQSCPTFAPDLAALIVKLVGDEEEGLRMKGILHACGRHSVSRFEYACAIMEARAQLGLKVAALEPTTQAAFGATAARPVNSTLDCHALESVFGYTLQGVRDVLPSLVSQIARGGPQ
jgi:dTDP-4-dehydrorhamnose reductase